MKAIVRRAYGGPEQLAIQQVPAPTARSGDVVVRVRALGLNRAEIYFRQGAWGDVHAISGIECVGEVAEDADGVLARGQLVIAMMGGMGRTIAGSYAEYTRVPRHNVVAIHNTHGLSFAELAAIPESYATAWTCLEGNLALQARQTLLIRGATSALGQAALNIAVRAGACVIVTVRDHSKADSLRELGAQCVVMEKTSLSEDVRREHPRGIDAVLDLVGTTTLLDSLKAVRRDGRVCLAGFLGGSEPVAQFQPLMHLPSGVHLSFFGSAFVFGSQDYPLDAVPFDSFFLRAAQGLYRAKPAHVFAFDEIVSAHRMMDRNATRGKVVVTM